MTEWEWYTTPHMVHLFMHLVAKASHEDKKFKGINVKRGQLTTGRKQLALETGLSENQIYDRLKKLELTGEITIESNNRFSIITIVEYGKYQQNENRATANPTTNQQQTNNKPTRTKNEKNYKNEKKPTVVEKEILKWLKRQEKNNPEGYLHYLKNNYGDVLERAWKKSKSSSVDFVEICKHLKKNAS